MGMIVEGSFIGFGISYYNSQEFEVCAPEGVEVEEIYAYIKWKLGREDQAICEFPRRVFEGEVAFDMSFASSQFEYLVIGFNGDDPVAFYRADASTLRNLDRINLIRWQD